MPNYTTLPNATLFTSRRAEGLPKITEGASLPKMGAAARSCTRVRRTKLCAGADFGGRRLTSARLARG